MVLAFASCAWSPILPISKGRIQQKLSEGHHFRERHTGGRKMNVSSQSLFVFCCRNVSRMSVACKAVMKQLPSSLTIAFAIYLCVLVCFWIGDFSHLIFHGVRRKSKENDYRDSALPGSVQLKYWLGLWELHWTRNSLMPEFAADVWNNFYLQQNSFLLTRCLQID